MSEWIARAKAIWQGLTTQERLLVSVAGGMLVVVVFTFGIVFTVLGSIDSAGQSARSAEGQMQTMQRLRREWDQISGRLAKVEAAIQQDRDQRNLITLLDSLATSSNVKIDSLQEGRASSEGGYEETKVDVSLKNVTLAQVVKYLNNIESAPRPLSIKSLRIKARSDQAALLDVNFSVSAFKAL